MSDHILSFQDLNLSSEMISALEKKSFQKPSPIQAKVVPILMTSNSNIVAQAQTGTGKTAAFGIPLIEKIDPKTNRLQGLILTPTRELCLQVTQEIQSLTANKKINIISIYGGQSFTIQFKQLKNSPHIIVATPGRFIDQLNRKNINLDYVSYFVLDEADEMLSMGFSDDIETIMKHIEKSSPQILLFSATFSPNIKKLVQKYIPDHVKVEAKSPELTTNLTEQLYYQVHPRDKFEALVRILETNPSFYGIVFCSTKLEVQNLNQKLAEKGYKSGEIHGDLSQAQRESTLGKFRKQIVHILVATDVAARGIDINNLTHVINFSLPQDPENYVHRIGRTGRAGKKGIAISLISSSDERKLYLIKKTTKANIQKSTLPSIDDLITLKKEAVLSSLKEFLEKNPSKLNSFTSDIYQQITETYPDIESEKLTQLVLQYFLQDKLSKNQFRDIQDSSFSSTSPTSSSYGKGEKRLFIALGKKQGTTPKTIIDLLKEKGEVNSQDINKISILEDFSFATVSRDDAYLIIQNEKKTSDRSKKPLISFAKENNNNNSYSRHSRSRNYSRR